VRSALSASCSLIAADTTEVQQAVLHGAVETEPVHQPVANSSGQKERGVTGSDNFFDQKDCSKTGILLEGRPGSFETAEFDRERERR